MEEAGPRYTHKRPTRAAFEVRGPHHVAQRLCVVGIAAGPLLLRLEREQRQLVARTRLRHLLLLVRALLPAAQLHRLLLLLDRRSVLLQPKPRPLRDRVVVHRLQLLAGRVATVDDLCRSGGVCQSDVVCGIISSVEAHRRVEVAPRVSLAGATSP